MYRRYRYGLALVVGDVKDSLRSYRYGLVLVVEDVKESLHMADLGLIRSQQSNEQGLNQVHQDLVNPGPRDAAEEENLHTRERLALH